MADDHEFNVDDFFIPNVPEVQNLGIHGGRQTIGVALFIPFGRTNGEGLDYLLERRALLEGHIQIENMQPDHIMEQGIIDFAEIVQFGDVTLQENAQLATIQVTLSLPPIPALNAGPTIHQLVDHMYEGAILRYRNAEVEAGRGEGIAAAAAVEENAGGDVNQEAEQQENQEAEQQENQEAEQEDEEGEDEEDDHEAEEEEEEDEEDGGAGGPPLRRSGRQTFPNIRLQQFHVYVNPQQEAEIFGL